MKALFTSFPASDYIASKKYYEEAIGLRALREYEGTPHRFTNYDLKGTVLKVYEWTENYYGSEPPRDFRRLRILRGLEHEQSEAIFPGG